MSIKCTLTYAELEKQVRSRQANPKKFGYGFWVRPFMPTEGDRGFEGYAIAKVTRTEFLRTAKDLLRNLEKRGAKLTVSVPTEDHESYLI